MDWFEGLFELFDGIIDIFKAKRDGVSKKEIVLIAVLTITVSIIAIIK